MDNFEDRIGQLEAIIRSHGVQPTQEFQNEIPGNNTAAISTLSDETFDLPENWDEDHNALSWNPVTDKTILESNPLGPPQNSLLASSPLEAIFTIPRIYGEPSVLSAINGTNYQDHWKCPNAVLNNSNWPSIEDIALRCERELPSAHEASLMLQEYLMDYNSVIPLFDRQTIALHFQDCYSGSSDVKGVSWGAVYVVLGIAHQLRAMSPLAKEDDNVRAIKYLDRCMRRIPELLMDTPSLALVQCLLGVALLVRGTPRAQSAALFVSIAMRLAQDMGYNEKRAHDGDSAFQAEQENFVFWIAFFLDADLSLRSNRLPTQSYEHIDVNLPEDDNPGGAGILRAEVGGLRANILRIRAQMGLIQAEIMEELFSVKARRRPVTELTSMADKITLRLDQWRDNWLFQVRPNDLMRMLQRSEMVHILVLEAAYFTTTCALQSEIIQTGQRTDCSILMSDLLAQADAAKEPPCYPHARRFLELVAVCPSGHMSCTWMVFDAIVISSCVLLKRASTHPHEELSADDVRQTEFPLRIVTMLAAKTGSPDLLKIQVNCQVLLERANQALGRR
ncbi:hypothetical protein LTR84_011107 [Exophiala bonariae]|uniref:Xylanolytic transcriptional activator regulatory domain-containing protein n=1 Tax=Exophiala bonariae TaxID=1690606 RepID=A0AAV9NKT0_9EURO|nr:hypothetical protein LTR84_011107 [Exophiala bonariae]